MNPFIIGRKLDRKRGKDGMTKKDILELKRRFKKEDCTFTRLCGCYVNGQKNIILHINETFLNLAEEEFFKYLEIAKKTLSGSIGNNLLELAFLPEEGNQGGKQQFFLGLRESKLKNEALLDRFYELIIENFDYAGNYLILIFHDAYDVITKTSDNGKLDESEEVYEYLLCAICPVELTKPGLGYRQEENRIAARIRDWVVLPPETGFVFPAFTDRSSDIHSVMYYTKNPKEPHSELMGEVLGCQLQRTAAEERTTFQAIIENTTGESKEESEEVFMEIQQVLHDIVEERKESYEKEPLILNSDTLQTVITNSNIPENIASQIEKSCTEAFGDLPPVAENLIDAKALEINAKKKKEQNLQKEVVLLKQELEETKAKITSEAEDTAMESETTEESTSDIILKVKPQKVPEIKSQMIDGKKYILIPMEEEEQAMINGINATI